ncbi:MAG: Ig-like domain-containing protein, partial [Methylococcales bacterium]|nr:Ig-like domain-containing protein [Methylococcales bacterium]
MMNSDKIPPELVSALPQKANTAVAVNQDIVLTLSESIRVGKGNITVSNGGSDIRVIPVNSLEITVEDNKLI